MENVNGGTQHLGAVHCDRAPGGICNETTGISNKTDLPDAGTNWHVYRLVIDRTASNWQEESLTWFLDDVQFHQVTGARIANEVVWASVAHNKVFFLLNVAVGGRWPGPPNASTHEGRGAGMEVKYVAQYESSGAPSVTSPRDNCICKNTPGVPQDIDEPGGQPALEAPEYPNPDDSVPV
ncbi:hypothetical protein FGRMN_11272, partial [Fusarium graminum]